MKAATREEIEKRRQETCKWLESIYRPFPSRPATSPAKKEQPAAPMIPGLLTPAQPAPSAATSGAAPPGLQPRPQPVCEACRPIELKPLEHRVMQAIAERPAELVLDRCDRLSVAREEDSVARRRLANWGLIEQVRVGNKRILAGPSRDRGAEWAQRHGIRIPVMHGSLAHEFCTRTAEAGILRALPGSRAIRRETGEPAGVRPDSLIMGPEPENRRIALQSVVGHEPVGEARGLLRLSGAALEDGDGARSSWMDLVVCVAASRAVKKLVEEAVREQNNGEMPTNLVVLDIEDLLKADFSWSDVVGHEV